MTDTNPVADLPAPGTGFALPENATEAIINARRHFLEAMVTLACLVDATEHAPENMAGIANTLLKSVCDGIDAIEHSQALGLDCAGRA